MLPHNDHMEAGDNTAHEIEQELMRRRKDGSLVKDKSRLAYDAFVLPFLVEVVRNEAAPFGNRAEASKMLMETGDLRPKVAAQVAVGTSLHVSINLPEGQLPTPGAHTPTPSHPDTPTLLLNVTPTAPEPEPKPGPEPQVLMKMPPFQTGPVLTALPGPRALMPAAPTPGVSR